MILRQLPVGRVFVRAASPLIQRFGSAIRDAGRAMASPERGIRVPFAVPAHGEIEIATLSGSAQTRLAAGEYALTFWHGRSKEAMWGELVFERVPEPIRAEILRADASLAAAASLVMIARPA